MRVFITGATSGIGKAIAKLYLLEGAEVAILGREPQKIGSEITDRFKNLKLYSVDINDRVGVAAAINNFAADKGLDLLIANAGIGIANKTQLPDFNLAHKIIDTNVHGVLNAFEPALNIMLKQKRGHLVATASVAGMAGLPRTGAYSASKAAVLKLCESFAIDLAPLGIDVTAIAPGFVDTPLTQKNHHPMPFLVPEDVAAKKIKRAIEKKSVLYIFPWQMECIILLLDKMPRWLYRKLISVFNYTEKGKDV